MALSHLAAQLRQKKTDLLFQDTHITLLGLLEQWRAEAMSALESQQPQIEAALKIANGTSVKNIERLYKAIVEMFTDAMNLPAGESLHMVEALKQLQREVRSLPDRTQTQRGSVRNAYSIAKGPLDDMAAKAMRLIVKRHAELVAVGKRLGIEPEDVTNDDLDREPEDGYLVTGAKQLGSRFNARASSRSAVWAFMSDLTGRQRARRKGQREATKRAAKNRGAGQRTLAKRQRESTSREVETLSTAMSAADMNSEQWSEPSGPSPTSSGSGRTPAPAAPTGPSITTPPTPEESSPSAAPAFGSQGTWREKADRQVDNILNRQQRAAQQERYPAGHERAGQFRPRTTPTPAPDTAPTKDTAGDTTTVLTSIDATLKGIAQHEQAQSASLNTLATLSQDEAQGARITEELREDQNPDAAPARTPTAAAPKEPASGLSTVMQALMSGGLSGGLTQFLKSTILPAIMRTIPGLAGSLLGGGALTTGAAITGSVGLALGAKDLITEISQARSDIDATSQNLSDAQKEYANALKNVETTSSLVSAPNKFASRLSFGVLPEWVMPSTYVKKAYDDHVGSAYLRREQERLGLTDAEVAAVRGNRQPIGPASPRIERYMSTETGQFSPRRAHSQDVVARVGQTLSTESTTALSPEFIAAILGNMEAESAYNPGIMNGIGAFGLTQVLDPKPGSGRKTNLMKFAAEYTGRPMTQEQVGRDVELQTRFLLAEMGLLGDKWKAYVDPLSAKMVKKTVPALTAQLDASGASEAQRIAAFTSMFAHEFERPSAKELDDSLTRRVESATTARQVLSTARVLPATSPLAQGDTIAAGRAQTTQQMAQAAATGQTDPTLTTVVSSNRTSNIVVNAPSGGSAALPPPINQRLSVMFDQR